MCKSSMMQRIRVAGAQGAVKGNDGLRVTRKNAYNTYSRDLSDAYLPRQSLGGLLLVICNQMFAAYNSR